MPAEPTWTEVADLPGPLARAAEEYGVEAVLGEPGSSKGLWGMTVYVTTTVRTSIEVLVLAADEAEARRMAMHATYGVDIDSAGYLLDDAAEWSPESVSDVEKVEVPADAD